MCGVTASQTQDSVLLNLNKVQAYIRIKFKDRISECFSLVFYRGVLKFRECLQQSSAGLLWLGSGQQCSTTELPPHLQWEGESKRKKKILWVEVITD